MTTDEERLQQISQLWYNNHHLELIRDWARQLDPLIGEVAYLSQEDPEKAMDIAAEVGIAFCWLVDELAETIDATNDLIDEMEDINEGGSALIGD